MRKLYWLFLVCLTVIWQSKPGNAQVKNLNFRQLSLEEGLSQSSVDAIVQDNDGFMWFGTQDGLNQYDGYRFKVHKKRAFDSTSLSNSHVQSLLKDKAGNLWIGTEGGLNMLDKRTNRFLNLSHLLRGKEDSEAMIVNCLYEDSQGIIWVGTHYGVVRLIPSPGKAGEPKKYQSIRSVYEEKDSNSLSGYGVISLFEDSRGDIWIGTFGGGINRLRRAQASVAGKEELRFENYRNSRLPIFHLEGKAIRCIVQDAYEYLWIGTGLGLYRVKADSAEMPENYLQNLSDKPSSQRHFLSSNYIFKLLLDKKGVLWVGTYGSGINQIHFDENGKVREITQLQGIGRTAQRDFILSMYESKDQDDGTLWFGLQGGGVLQYNQSKNNFKLYRHDVLSSKSLSESSIFSVLKDTKGFLWVGTNNGLTRITTINQAYKHYYTQWGDSLGLSDNSILALHEDREGTLWIGTLRGLNRYNSRNQTIERVNVQLEGKGLFKLGMISSLLEDREGNLWIGTNYDLMKMNKQTLTCRSYGYHEKNGSRLTGGRITTIYEDREGIIWIGTYAGLNRYNRQTDDFTHYATNLNNKNSLSGNSVFSMQQDRNGAYWIATDLGLNKLTFAESRPRFTHYMEKDGLSNNFIYGVLEDEVGKIWMSTNLGISVFDPRSNTFFNYDVADGLQSKEFNSGAYSRAKDGEMFFGGINGLNSFFPDKMAINRHVPKIRITSLYKFEQPVNLDSLRVNSNAITLSYDENFFSFDFVALDYANPHKNQYAYQLVGFDKDWIYSGNRHYASFTNLDPGEYVFKVKGSNDSGVWNDDGIASIRIIINPPFWMTWWFYTLSLAVLLLAVKLVHDLRVRSKLRRLLELEKVRIMESERVRKQTASDFHDEMGNRITRIGVLTELIKVQLNGHSEGEIGSLLSKISENCNTLYNGTRDFIWSINPDNNSFYEVAVRLKDFGDELFDNTAVHFQVGEIEESLKVIKLPMDWSRQLILIFKEALNNSLKHADCRNVQLQFRVVDEEAFICLTDDGLGFEFGQGRGGTGLVNMTNRAKKINSRLAVHSEKYQGTKIIFTGKLPQNGGVLV